VTTPTPTPTERENDGVEDVDAVDAAAKRKRNECERTTTPSQTLLVTNGISVALSVEVLDHSRESRPVIWIASQGLARPTYPPVQPGKNTAISLDTCSTHLESTTTT